MRRHDFLYLPAGIRHGISNRSEKPSRLIVVGFKIPAGTTIQRPPGLLLANIDYAPKQVVGNHPPSTLYPLWMGDTQSERDKIAAGHVLTSLFVMEIAPGGGTTRVEGRHPPRPSGYCLGIRRTRAGRTLFEKSRPPETGPGQSRISYRLVSEIDCRASEIRAAVGKSVEPCISQPAVRGHRGRSAVRRQATRWPAPRAPPDPARRRWAGPG